MVRASFRWMRRVTGVWCLARRVDGVCSRLLLGLPVLGCPELEAFSARGTGSEGSGWASSRCLGAAFSLVREAQRHLGRRAWRWLPQNSKAWFSPPLVARAQELSPFSDRSCATRLATVLHALISGCLESLAMRRAPAVQNDHKEGSAGTHISDSNTTAAKKRVQRALDTQKAAITAQCTRLQQKCVA